MRPWFNLSLRARLVLLFVGVLAILLSFMEWVFYQDARNLLVETTASHLRARAKPVIEHWLYGKPLLSSGERKAKRSGSLKGIAPFLARDLTSRNVVAQVIDPEGKVLAVGKRLPEEPDPASPVPRYVRLALEGENEVTYESRQGRLPLLVVLIPLRTAPGSEKVVGVVQLTASLESVQKTLTRHGFMLAGIAFAVLSVGAFLGVLIVSSSLEELKKMVTTCQLISEGNLDQRIALPDRDDEIGQLARAFDGMVERIAEMMEAQRRFIANAAHELRTPLTALQGSLEVLLRGVQDDPRAAARLIQGMHREVQRLTHLCERLLDLSRLDSLSAPHKQQISLEAFFKTFLPQLRRLVPNHVLKIETGPRVTITFDPEMFRQVWYNLTRNAAQHTPPGGKITLGWRLTSDPEGVIFWVTDEGEGIPPEDLPRVFEPFYRGRSERQGVEGTGLGLSIVKTILSAHGGEIGIESVVGKGTRVTFHVPFG